LIVKNLVVDLFAFYVIRNITPLIAVSREEHHPEPMARFTEPPPFKEHATELEEMCHQL
jgi:hypothetical protein